MSPDILKDMLSVDGDLSLLQIKENRDETPANGRHKLGMLYLAMNYFKQKMEKRRRVLDECIDHSKKNTFARKEYWWKSKFEEIMSNKEDND